MKFCKRATDAEEIEDVMESVFKIQAHTVNFLREYQPKELLQRSTPETALEAVIYLDE